MEKIYFMKIKKIEDKYRWAEITSISMEYNLLSSPTFFEGLTCPHNFYLIEDHRPLLSAVVFNKTDSKKNFFLQDFNYNQGLYFLINDKKKQFEATKFFLDEITKNHDYLRFSLNYNLQDIRPFQWHNYPNFEFKFNTVYSSIINLNENKSFENVLGNFRYTRRREMKLFEKSDYDIQISDDYAKFFNLYDSIYKDILDPFVIDTHYKLIENSFKNKFSRLNFLYKENDILGGSIFYFDNDRAYYAFSVVEKRKENFSLTTPLIIEQIKFFYKKKIKTIDMMGINSPGRGDYKESFGGQVIKFYEALYEKKN